MNKNEFKNSSEYDAIFRQLINLEKPSVAMIQTRWKLSFQKAKELYEEVSLYQNEVFIHGMIYELSFWEEPPTIARIMREFNVSYPFAEMVFEKYMEVSLC